MYAALPAQKTSIQFLEPNARWLSEGIDSLLLINAEGEIFKSFRNSDQIETLSLGKYQCMVWLWQQEQSYLRSGSLETYALNFKRRISRSAQERMKAVFPVPSDLFQPEVDLYWKKFKNADIYHVYLTDRFNHILMRKTTSDTTLHINLKDYSPDRGVCYFWYVEPDSMIDARSDEICLTWVIEDLRLFILDELEKIDNIPGQAPSTMHILKAALFEQHKMYVEAMSEYKKALQHQPDADDLRRMYAMFLVRVGLIKNAREVWN